MPGVESNIERKARLEQAGKWREYLRFREGLQTAGFSKKDAFNSANEEYACFGKQAVTAEAAPEPNGQPAAPIETEPKLPAEKAGGAGESPPPRRRRRDKRRKTTLAEDVEWVYHNFSEAGVKEHEAISAGAWNYLTWARENEKNRDEFFGKIMPKFAPRKGANEQEARFKDDGRQQLGLLERLDSLGYCDEPVLPASAEGQTRESGVAQAALAAV